MVPELRDTRLPMLVIPGCAAVLTVPLIAVAVICVALIVAVVIPPVTVRLASKPTAVILV